MDFTPNMMTGDLQQLILKFFTGRIHCQPDLQRREPAHNTSIDTTLPVPKPVTNEPSEVPFFRLALVNLQKYQQMTIRPVPTTSRNFDNKREKFELFGDCFIRCSTKNTTEQTKIKYSHSLLKTVPCKPFEKFTRLTVKLWKTY